MKTTTELKEFAQLAQAAYGELDKPTIYRNDRQTEIALQSSPNGAFSEGQATDFTNRYSILNQYRDNNTPASGGFSATLIQDKANPNRLVLSFAGTEVNGGNLVDDLLTDAQIGVVGYAMPQALAAYRYVKGLQTGANVAVNYSEAEIQRLYLLDGKNSRLHIDPDLYAVFKANLLTDRGVDVGQGDGVALMGAGKEIDLAGHSLGGHLAMLVQRLFPRNTFDDVVTVDAVTFYGLPLGQANPARILSEVNLSKFGEWDGTKILRMESVGDGVSEIGTVHPGTTLTIGMETQKHPLAPFTDNHSVANVADGLALTELMGKLDARYMADPRVAKPVFDAASNTPISSYETLLDGLRRIIQGNALPATTLDNTSADQLSATRKSLYDNLKALAESPAFAALKGKVTLNLPGASLATTAKSDFAAFLSLNALSPLIMSTTDETAVNALKARNPLLSATWTTDNNARLYGDTSKVFDYSDNWYSDRAAMLDLLIIRNQQDFAQEVLVGGPSVAYKDITTGLAFERGLASNSTDKPQVIFGSAGNDLALEGQSKEDHIYGGAGNDTLDGKMGNDYLEGGNGKDTYVFAGNSGIDTIFDSDGVGCVQIDGDVLSGGTRTPGQSSPFVSNDGKYSYVLTGNDLVVNGAITIKDFRNKDLGIYLDEKENPNDPPRPPVYDPNNASILRRLDPLVLDLNGNGQIDSISSTQSGSYFDFNGDGISEKAGWIAPGDGFLALDTNSNGVVDGLSELFGSNQLDGFAELATHDSNGDGTINVLDQDFSKLRVWQDTNQDGISQTDEIRTLDTLGISSINLSNTSTHIPQGDNLVAAIGSFVQNGMVHLAADIDLAVNFGLTDSNPGRPLGQAPLLDPEVYGLPWLRGYGDVKSLHVAFQERPALRDAASALLVGGWKEIIGNFGGFVALWTGLSEAHANHGVSRSSLTTEDKAWMLERLTGQNIQKNAIEAADFASITPGTNRLWNANYIDAQWNQFLLREANIFAIQANTSGWLRGVSYSLSSDRLTIADTTHWQQSLIEHLNSVTDKEDAAFSASVISQLKLDGVAIDTSLVEQAIVNAPFGSLFTNALNNTSGRLFGQTDQGGLLIDTTDGYVAVGESSNDYIVGGNKNDLLAGGRGNDWLFGDVGDDVLEGGEGDDHLYADTTGFISGSGNDILKGGAGNDILQGGGGNDTYVFDAGDGQDTILANHSGRNQLQILKFGEGIVADAVIFRRELNDLIIGFNGTTDQLRILDWAHSESSRIDRFEFSNGTVWDCVELEHRTAPLLGIPIYGTDSADSIQAWERESANIFGLAGNDSLLGSDGNDTLSGGSGDDRLYGMKGNDVLEGGIGNDYLLGGSGRDTYVFNLGDGQDTVSSEHLVTETGGTLRFGLGIAASGIELSRDGADLIFHLQGSTDQVRVYSWSRNQFRLDSVEFADGVVWDASALKAMIDGLQTKGTVGDDTLIGWENSKDTLQGREGNDYLYGGNDNDVLEGGLGNDILRGDLGNDIYLFSRGDGQDTLRESSDLTENLDVLRFGPGILADEILFSREGDTLILSIKDSSDRLHIENWGASTDSRIERVEFADGTTWNAAQLQARSVELFAVPLIGTEESEYLPAWFGETVTLQGLGGSDHLAGGNGNDTLIGGRGDDRLEGGRGNDTYLFNLGDGQDMLSEFTGEDLLRFGQGISSSDIHFRRQGQDLILSIDGTSDQIQIRDWGSSSTFQIERVEFADGSAWSSSDLHLRVAELPIVGTEGNDRIAFSGGNKIINGLGGDDLITSGEGDDVLVGGTGNDALQGGDGNDTYSFNAGDGQDTITESGGVDTLRFGAGIAEGDIHLSRKGDDLFFSVGGGADQIQVQRALIGGGYQLERVEFSDGSFWDLDQLREKIAALPIAGTNGNDDLQGGSQNNTYLFDLGGGQDTITDSGGIDTLRFGVGIAAADIHFSRHGNDLVLSVIGTADTLRIKGWTLSEDKEIERIEFANGTWWDKAQLQALIAEVPIFGTNGNDYLQGSAGDDVFVFNLGGGQDTVTDVNGLDIFRFGDGIAPTDIQFARSGNDLTLSFLNGTEKITVKNWGSGNRIERFEFSNGVFWDQSQLQARIPTSTIEGSSTSDSLTAWVGFNDHLKGLGGNDALYGKDGNDTLEGGSGADYLSGAEGNDSYLFNMGDGRDTILETDWVTGNVDRLSFGIGILPSDIVFARSGDDLILVIQDGSDQIRVSNWWLGKEIRIEQFDFADGTVWDAAQLREYTNTTLPIIGKSGGANLDGGGGNDIYLFVRGSGKHSITDPSGNDVLRFGKGIDPSEIQFSRTANDLILSINGSTDQVRIAKWRNSASERIERVEFSDGTVWDEAQLQTQVREMLGRTALEGTNSADYLVAWPDENAHLLGMGGDDNLYGQDGNDTIVGGAGNDHLSGRGGNDVYVFNLGDGQDSIDEQDWTYGSDALRFGVGIVESDIQISRNGKDLVLRINGSTDQVTIKNWGDGESSHIERVEFASGAIWDQLHLQERIADSLGTPIIGTEADDYLMPWEGERNAILVGQGGNDVIIGGVGDNILDGGVGDDYMEGHAGNDLFLFNRGGGHDRIAAGGGTDTLRFGVGISPNEVIVSRDQWDLLLSINGSDDQVRIGGWGYGDSYRISQLEFADGTIWNRALLNAQVASPTAIGTDSSDDLRDWQGNSTFMQGLGGDDYLEGGDGDDVLDGGAGNDYLSGGDGASGGNGAGGNGNDVYIFDIGSGQDSIVDHDDTYGNIDTLRFGVGIAANQITFSRVGDDLVLSIGNDEKVRIQNWNNGESYKIERVEFADGIVWDRDKLQLEAARAPTYGTSERDNLFAWQGVANSMHGLEGDDTLVGNEFADVLEGGAGNDRLEGGAGNDVYKFSLGDGRDLILDLNGDADVLHFGNGITANDITFSRYKSDLLLNINATGDQVQISNWDYGATFRKGVIEFEGVLASNGENRTWHIREAEDGALSLQENNVGNSAPTVATAIGDQTAREDQIWSFTIPNGAFIDADANDSLTYTATLSDGSPLPTWIVFDAVTRTFSGTPTSADGGTYSLEVVATDKSGASAASCFVVNIADKFAGTGANINTISGPYAASVLNGTSRSENIVGHGNGDVINAGEGNNTITANGNTTIAAGSGDDVVTSVWGDVTMNLGEGNNTVTNTNGKSVIKTGAGSDNITTTWGDDVIDAGDGNNVVKAGWGNNTVTTGSDNDTIVTEGANDTINSGAGDDIINSGWGVDAINAGAGSDTIIAGGGSKTIRGGTGSDTIAANSYSSDRYYFAAGDGQDKLSDIGGNDVLVLENIRSDQVWLSHVGSDLKISLIGTDDSFLVQNWYTNGQSHVEIIQTSDGKTLLDSQVQNLVNAMAAFAPPAPGQTTLPASYNTALAPVLVANWK